MLLPWSLSNLNHQWFPHVLSFYNKTSRTAGNCVLYWQYLYLAHNHQFIKIFDWLEFMILISWPNWLKDLVPGLSFPLLPPTLHFLSSSSSFLSTFPLLPLPCHLPSPSSLLSPPFPLLPPLSSLPPPVTLHEQSTNHISLTRVGHMHISSSNLLSVHCMWLC